MDVIPQPRDDTLSDVLSSLNVRSAIYCLSELRGPWGFRVAEAPAATFHLVLEGTCHLEVDTQDPVALRTHELVLLVRGHAHTMRDEITSPVRGLDDILAAHPPGPDARLVYGGSGRRTRLLCGGFRLAGPLPPSAAALLPDVLHLDASTAGLAAWLEPVVALLAREADTGVAGTAAILAKIADVFLAQALRTYLLGAQRAGILTIEPLRDAAVAEALEIMHRQPTRGWTLAALAKEVGMSRTAFSTRFRAAVGDTPIQHLANVRLGIAAGLLATSDANLFQIARSSGYDNDASLSRAFKRKFGISPGEYRRSAAGAPRVITV